MITARTVVVKKGDKISDVLKNDIFKHPSLKKAYLHTKRDNSLSSNLIQKNQKITLPFCASEGIKRSLAALNTNVTEINPNKKNLLPVPLSVGLTYGQFTVNQNSETLSMNFLKFQVAGKYKINNDYTLTGKASVASFFGINYSEAEENDVSASNYYPEFGGSISTKSGALSYGASYDLMNYFLIRNETDSITLDPSQLHRFSANGYYTITDKMGLFANLGYLNGFDSENISGFDMSVGGSYGLNNDGSYRIAPLFYYGSINSDLSSEAETSNAFALSFSADI